MYREELIIITHWLVSNQNDKGEANMASNKTIHRDRHMT